jgi:hypothetical protein
MAQSSSNDNGRALEYIIVEELRKNLNVTLINSTIQIQSRDVGKFKSLPSLLQNQYIQASIRICAWINNQFLNQKINVERCQDNSGTVYDIVIQSNINNLNLSIKHNHNALKHPRPYSLAQACNFIEGSSEDILHRNQMQITSLNYRNNLNGITKYNQNNALKLKMLNDICKTCKQSLDIWLKNTPRTAQNLFSFLVSSNFKKIIVHTQSTLKIEILDFTSIPNPSSFTSAITNQYLRLDFNNGWVLNCRLHTASENISTNQASQLSLKFDVSKIQGSISVFTI